MAAASSMTGPVWMMTRLSFRSSMVSPFGGSRLYHPAIDSAFRLE
jgi:hypothetical protein